MNNTITECDEPGVPRRGKALCNFTGLHGWLPVFTTSKLEKNADAVSTYVSKEIDWKIIGHCVPQA